MGKLKWTDILTNEVVLRKSRREAVRLYFLNGKRIESDTTCEVNVYRIMSWVDKCVNTQPILAGRTNNFF